MAGPPRLGHRNAPVLAFEIEVGPLGIQHLALARARQNQHWDNELEHRVVALADGRIQALRLFDGEITLVLVIFLE